MIHIKRPELVSCDNGVRLQAVIMIDGLEQLLWFEVAKEYADYLVDDRADAFVVAFVNYAMMYGYHIRSDAPLSEKLFYQLTHYYIPALNSADEVFRRIGLYCDVTDQVLENAGAVGTGMSGGIDSFSTLYLHSNGNCQDSQRVTHLTFFNVGAALSSNSNRYSYEDIVAFENQDIIEQTLRINQQRYDRAAEFAQLHGYPLVRIDSNIMEIQPIRYKYVNVQRNCAAVLAMQKLFKVYYYASSYQMNDFNIRSEKDAAYYEIFSLPMFSTDVTQFYSGGSAYSRIKKTQMVSNYQPSYDFLNVCWRDDVNCGKCAKCVRTLVTLDLLGALEKYSDVFDVDTYMENREKIVARVFAYAKTDPLFSEIVAYSRNTETDWKEVRIRRYAVCFSIMKSASRLLPERIKVFLRKVYRVFG